MSSAYHQVLDRCWEQVLNLESSFPEEICDWIVHKQELKGVPSTYLAWPLLTAVAHASQHTRVLVGKEGCLSREPTIIYALVVGRTSTNKSASLDCVMKEVRNPGLSEAIFRGGTLDGLLKLMSECNEACLGQFDELYSFLDNIDQGRTGNMERGAYLEMYNAMIRSKHVKTSANVELKDPRYSIIAYTQPPNALQFAQKGDSDGFFQRFLVTLPKEVGTPSTRLREVETTETTEDNGLVDLSSVIQWIYHTCKNEEVELTLSPEVMELWYNEHDEYTRYRLSNPYDDLGLSRRGKARGQTVRVAGLLTLLREALVGIDVVNYSLVGVVTADDYGRACHIVEYAQQISEALMGGGDANPPLVLNTPPESPSSTQGSTPGTPTSSPSSSVVKQGIPSPNSMTLDFLILHRGHVKKLLAKEKTPLSTITGNNMYPVIDNQKGSTYGLRFVEGVCNLGLGRIDTEGNGKATKRVFKRHHPDDDMCPDRENVQEKYRKLELN